MRNFFFLIILFFNVALKAQTHPLLDDREGKSFFLSEINEEYYRSLPVNPERLKADLLAASAEVKGEPCAFKLIAKLEEKRHFPQYDLATYFHLLRSHRIIDDVIYRLSFKVLNIGYSFEHSEVDLTQITNESKHYPIAQFLKRDKAGKCFDENMKLLSSDLRAGKKKFKLKPALSPLIKAALTDKILSPEGAEMMKRAMKEKLQDEPLTLMQYQQKKQILRTEHPVPKVESHFITQKVSKKVKTSHRQKLYDQYTYVQISRMGNLLKVMRQIQDSDKIVINTYGPDQKTIIHQRELLPHERYGYAIKFLRVEMKNFQKNPLFEGKKPSFTDVIASAYELGFLAAEEIESVAKIEEFWNPKKTFLEKSMVWIRMFGTLSAVIVPPPYGFIAILGIMVIEATTKKIPNEDDVGLF
jgi:hypothetical protein